MSREVAPGLPADTKLIFLVGAPRSGTTWLQLMLAASPSIATTVETNLFCNYTRSLLPAWRYLCKQCPVGLHNLMDEDEYLTLVRDFALKVMTRILATKPGATIVLEKTPEHALYWRDILTVFPNAHFIHIIRDPRAVVASVRAASRGWGSDWLPRRIADACSFWATRVTAAREIAGATKNYREVRYQDLKDNGIATLRSAFAWCGVDISKAQVASILAEHKIERLRAALEPGQACSDRDQSGAFFRKGEVDSWRTDLTQREIWLVERLTSELMQELGFECYGRAPSSWQFAAVLPALVAEWLRGGLAWRMQNYADALRHGIISDSSPSAISKRNSEQHIKQTYTTLQLWFEGTARVR